MNAAALRRWVAGNQRDLVLVGLALLAGFQFGRVAGRLEERNR